MRERETEIGPRRIMQVVSQQPSARTLTHTEGKKGSVLRHFSAHSLGPNFPANSSFRMPTVVTWLGRDESAEKLHRAACSVGRPFYGLAVGWCTQSGRMPWLMACKWPMGYCCAACIQTTCQNCYAESFAVTLPE